MEKSNGFTLVEILLALLISGVLVLGIHAAYRQSLLIWSRIEEGRPIYQAGRTIIDTLRNELSCMYMPPVAGDSADEEGSGEEIFGEKNSFELVSLSDGTVQLSFFTLAPCFQNSVASAKIAKVTYRFKESVLNRSEQLCSGEKIIGMEVSQAVTDGLAQFRVWVWGTETNSVSDRWLESYASKNQPPEAVKILLLWPETKNVPSTKFETCILIACDVALSSS